MAQYSACSSAGTIILPRKSHLWSQKGGTVRAWEQYSAVCICMSRGATLNKRRQKTTDQWACEAKRPLVVRCVLHSVQQRRK